MLHTPKNLKKLIILIHKWMEMIKKIILVCCYFISVLGSLSAQDKWLTWKFPLPRTHTGVLMGNGIQGLMIWGKGNQLNITISRAGFWDHRGGKAFGARTNFKTLRRLLETQQDDSIKAAFKRSAPREDYPNRPYQLGGGRLEIHLPDGYVLKEGILNLNTAKLSIFFANKDGRMDSLKIGQAVPDEVAWVEIPEALLSQSKLALVASYDHQQVKKQLSKIRVDAPERWQDKTQQIEGFTQTMPNDLPLSIAFQKLNNQIILFSHLGQKPQKAILGKVKTLTLSKLKEASTNWWKEYASGLPQVRIPDKTLQESYNYGLYKMACVHPPHGIPATLQGPFMEEQRIPPWSNDYHLNINIEMIYWPALASGKFDHLDPLWKMIKGWMPVMKSAGAYFYENDQAILMPHAVDDLCHVVGTFWTGTIDQACAAWMAQLAWLHYRYSFNETILKEVAYPLMEGTFEGYYAMMDRSREGELSLPVSVSPEFKGSRMDAWGKNASFQLAACKMTAQNLIKAAKVLGIQEDKRWQEVLDNLPDYAIFKGAANLEYPEYKDERIALWEGMDLVESHRHHSHLAGIYPFMSYQPFDKKHRQIVRNSISRWVYQGAGKWSGWCVPWAATLHARLGNVDAAISWLHYWQQNYTNLGRGTLHDADFQGVSLIRPPSKDYFEGDNTGKNDWNDYPFMVEHNEIMQLDAGFGVLDAIHNIFLQQRDSILHVLPYLPNDWRNFSFEGLHTEGGFVIDAQVKDASLNKIMVKSKQGGQLLLAPSMSLPFFLNGQINHQKVLKLDMKMGESIEISQHKLN